MRVSLTLIGIVVLATVLTGVFRVLSENQETEGPPSVQWAVSPQSVPNLRFQDAEGKNLSLSDFPRKILASQRMGHVVCALS
jgi:hypothetical protein